MKSAQYFGYIIDSSNTYLGSDCPPPAEKPADEDDEAPSYDIELGSSGCEAETEGEAEGSGGGARWRESVDEKRAARPRGWRNDECAD